MNMFDIELNILVSMIQVISPLRMTWRAVEYILDVVVELCKSDWRASSTETYASACIKIIHVIPETYTTTSCI